MFLSPAEIKQQQLREKRGAYEREDVDALIDNVVGSYQHVWLERDRLQARVEELERETTNTKELEQLLRDGLASAQRAAEQVKEEAERQVSGLVDNAKREAEELLAKARTKAEEVVAASRQTRDRLEEETSRLERANQDVRERYKAFLRKALSVVEGTAEQKAVKSEEATVAEADESAPIPGAEEHKGEVGWLATMPLMAATSDEVAESIERAEPVAKPPVRESGAVEGAPGDAGGSPGAEHETKPERQAEPEPAAEDEEEEEEEEEEVPATVLLSAVRPPQETEEPSAPQPAAEDDPPQEDAQPDKDESLKAPEEAYMTFRAVPAVKVAEEPPAVPEAEGEGEGEDQPGKDDYEDWTPKKD